MRFEVSHVVSVIGMVESESTLHIHDLREKVPVQRIHEHQTGNFIRAESDVVSNL
jgi:hypothetical protein